MKNNPIVSVVIPFYSGVEWLELAIESVLNQTYKNYEIIVVNDGSKENIDTIKYKFKENIKLINKINEGPASARNEGIRRALGKYIAFLDSDDIWEKDKLDEQIKAMEKHNSVWSQTMIEYFGDDIKNKIIDTSIYKGNVFPLCLVSFKIQTSAVVVRRDVLLSENIEFPKDKRYGQDTYVWLELAKKYPLLSIDKPYTKFRIRSNNAGFRAHVQLVARANMWKDIINNNTSVKKSDVPLILRFNYRMCVASENILELVKKSGIKEEKLIEIISKVLYAPSWIGFKIISKILK